MLVFWTNDNPAAEQSGCVLKLRAANHDQIGVDHRVPHISDGCFFCYLALRQMLVFHRLPLLVIQFFSKENAALDIFCSNRQREFLVDLPIIIQRN